MNTRATQIAAPHLRHGPGAPATVPRFAHKIKTRFLYCPPLRTNAQAALSTAQMRRASSYSNTRRSTSRPPWASAAPMPRAEDLDSERLATLVSLNHFEAALRYHGHLVAASVPIPPDRVYAKAALAALERSSQPDRINVFSTWFRLVPDADPSLDLRPIRAALLETGTPATNLSLIARFAVLAAEKGYSQRVWPDVLQLLITHSTLAFATRLMVEHEFAAVSYVLKAGSGREPEVRGRLRDQSVRACIKADWPEAAAALLLTAEGLYVPTRLHGAVIAMLEERGAPMEKLDQLRVARDASARYRRFEGRIALPGDLLMQLREVRTAIRARILDKYLDVPDFLVAYDKMKPNQRVLQILKSRALMRSDETARSWLNAEFFLLRHKNHGNRSLTLFVSNFTLEGFSSDAQALITGIADMRHVGPVSPRVPKPMVLPSHLQCGSSTRTSMPPIVSRLKHSSRAGHVRY
ncbi:hypothetical protein BD626DRAFT_57754 [Schizophyllum amplum]|uniref:Uncharacterized protein n=1 Tax=Schizophyllum amplum TaxID=97359 RepID=A0A550CBJ3_9AGAR|nr:hypothetical protein BD626DRAFT_57754 [Auriculariopsis ampla]